MLKKNQLPKTTYELRREGDVFMVTVPNYWGKGATMAEAKAKLRQISGRAMNEHRAWRVYSVHPDTYLQEMGYINHPIDFPPITIDEFDPPNN